MNYKIKEENEQLKVYNEELDILKDYVLISSKEWEYLNPRWASVPAVCRENQW